MLRSKTAVIGVVLLVAASPYLLLIAAEQFFSLLYQRRYDYQPVHAENRVSIGATEISLRDDARIARFALDRTPGRIQIQIGEETYDGASQVPIRTDARGPRRYHGWVALGVLRDRKCDCDRVAITERIPEAPGESRAKSIRITFVAEDGSVEIEEFARSKRRWPPYRAVLASDAAGRSLGFVSGVLNVWPSIFYPLIYPFATGLLGFALWMHGALSRRAQS